ncbi:multiple sugar transport system substrate-binding protein [Paenibacillus sp. PvP094]|uniref:ABC transporter substrate-binding protein n=1 Tax=Paenibacillus sp. PvP094 TaxID=3156394 RepID=UPI003398B4E0
MRKMKTLSGLIFLILMCLLLTSCTQAGQTEEGDQKTIRIMMWGNGPAEVNGDRQIIEEFEKQNQDIRVEIVVAPYDNIMQKFVTMSAGNDQPDLVWIQDVYLADFAEKGLLLELNKYMDREKLNKEDWLPGAMERGTWEDKLYALPRDLITINIAYNKDMFDEAGVTYPQDNWTWDEFLDAAKKLTKRDEKGRTLQFGMASYSWQEAIVANGGGLFSQDGSEVLMDSPETIEALQWVADLTTVHHVAPTTAESQGLGDLFLAGKAAMTFSGPWNWKAYTEETKFSFDVVETPAGKAGNKSQLLGLPIAIGSQTKHPDEAWRLLEFLTHGGGQDIQSNIVGAYPSVKRAEKMFLDGQYSPESVEAVPKAMKENTVVMPSFPNLAQAHDLIQPVVDEIARGKQRAEVALPKLADQIRKKFDMK